MLGPANEGARQSVKFLGMSGLRISGMVSNSCYSYSYLLLYRGPIQKTGEPKRGTISEQVSYKLSRRHQTVDLDTFRWFLRVVSYSNPESHI